MGYNLNYSSIRALQTAATTSASGWEEQYNSVLEDLTAFVNETSFSGTGADAIRQYLTDIHLPVCQSLLLLLEEYKARFALFVSGLYEYDSNKYANINEDALTEVTEELRRTGNELMEFREQVLGEMNGIHDLGAESILKSPEAYVSPLEDEILKIKNLRDRAGEYEHAAFQETEGLREHIAELLRVVQNLREQGEMDISRYEPGSLEGMPDLDRLKTLTWNSLTFQSENQEAIEAAYAHYTEVWEEIIDEIREQRIRKGFSLVIWSAVGIAATVLTFGALGPEAISMETAILGSFALAYDMSNMEEGALELYYGCVGDINTTAVNPIRDTVFFGWQEGYDVTGMAANIGFGYYSMRDLASVAGSAAGEGMVGNNLSSETTIDYSYKFDRELVNFNDGYEIRTTVEKDLVLVQYSSDAPDASLCYWTTIDEANELSTLDEYMNRLALSKDWGNRNTVKVARIPAGTNVKYAVGTARAQPLIADPRPGGGIQYLFNQFDSNWITEVRSLSN